MLLPAVTQAAHPCGQSWKDECTHSVSASCRNMYFHNRYKLHTVLPLKENLKTERDEVIQMIRTVIYYGLILIMVIKLITSYRTYSCRLVLITFFSFYCNQSVLLLDRQIIVYYYLSTLNSIHIVRILIRKWLLYLEVQILQTSFSFIIHSLVLQL